MTASTSKHHAPAGSASTFPHVKTDGRIRAQAQRQLNEDDGLPLNYDLNAICAYWDARPGAVALRLAEVSGILIPWLVQFAVDARLGNSRTNSGRRAAQLRGILARLGPCFVKLGQALSVRPDIVGPDAMNELRLLCDAVPSFPREIAFRTIEEELGQPLSVIFAEISEEPVAAASLGQVYRARLRSSGESVAVKVQRPDMLRTVSLDLYCLRFLARSAQEIQNRFTANQTDFLGLLDEWAKGTYKELDYVNEASNSKKFADLIHQKLPDVYIPAVYDEFTSRKILTMEWINGRKLSECSPAEIRSLVAKGVECFLVQFLSTGFFHSDPHSANIIRLDKGNLCIIDFGLMSTIEQDEMNAMVSAIVHLANRDYKMVVRDFVALKFLLPSADLDAVEKVIGPILDQALEGGGAESINFQSLSDELASVTFDFPFRIPPSFALLLRSLSVLEGIALIGDSKFKLIMEAFPFVSRLILTNEGPALRAALREVLYKDGVFSATRFRVLLQASQGFVSKNSAFVDFDSLPSDNHADLNTQLVEFLFSKDGFVLREIISEEVAKGFDIMCRDTYHRVATSLSHSVNTPAQTFLGKSAEILLFGSLMERSLGFFLFSPLSSLAHRELSNALPPISASEEQQLDNIRLVASWLLENGEMAKLIRLWPTIAPRSAVLARLVAGRISEKLVGRLFEDLIRRDGEVIGGRKRVSLLPSGPAP